MRTRATVAGLTSSAAPMAASVQPGPASPWLAFNRMRAWVRALAGATPRPIMVCSRARSCSDRTTMCRLRTSASCGSGFPGPHEHETEPYVPQVTTDEPLAQDLDQQDPRVDDPDAQKQDQRRHQPVQSAAAAGEQAGPAAITGRVASCAATALTTIGCRWWMAGLADDLPQIDGHEQQPSEHRGGPRHAHEQAVPGL